MSFPTLTEEQLEKLRKTCEEYERYKAEARAEKRARSVRLEDFAMINGLTIHQLKFYRKRDKQKRRKQSRTEESRMIRRFMNLSAPWPDGVWMLAEEGKLRLMRDAGTDNMQDDRCLAVVDLPIHTK